MTETTSERGEAESKSETAWIDSVIARLNGLYKRTDICIAHVVSYDEVCQVLQQVSRIFMEESNLTECEAPIKVVGDLHGQYQDMHALFDIIGRPPETKMLFLGDYVDRGPQSIEVAIYLFAMKIRHRDRVFILRGNHETASVNKIYGFYNECAMKYGVGLWWDFQYCFNRIPMAGLISKKVLCMHGGLSPELLSLDHIRAIVRPCEPLDKGLLIDLLWADPTNKGEGWFHSIRGMSYMFGKAIVDAYCKNLGIDLVIRAHQVVQDGYEMMAGRKLITVFSAPNYCGQFSNASAVVCLDADLQVSFQQMKLAAPPKARICPNVAADPDPSKARTDKEYIKPFTAITKPPPTPLTPPATPKKETDGGSKEDKKTEGEKKADEEKKDGPSA